MQRRPLTPATTSDVEAPPTDSSRRDWLRRAGQWGLGAAGLAAGCATADGDLAQAVAGGLPPNVAPAARMPIAAPLPADVAAHLMAPTQPGGALDEQWVFEALTRCPDGHLRVQLRDAVHKGRLEVELFRGPTANRPLARTQRWELYSYDGGRGDRQTPDHVRSAVDLVALRVGDNEESAAAVQLVAGVCTFDQRTVGCQGGGWDAKVIPSGPLH